MNDSCAEMSIGVICACMPSLAKTIQHHDQFFKRFQNLGFRIVNVFAYAISIVRGKKDQGSGCPPSQKRESHQKLQNFGPLENCTVNTFIIGAGHRFTLSKKDVIHLTHDLEQRECQTSTC